MDFPHLRYIILHMIKETACHAGHLDAADRFLARREGATLHVCPKS